MYTSRPVTEQCNTTSQSVVCTSVDHIGRPDGVQSSRPHSKRELKRERFFLECWFWSEFRRCLQACHRDSSLKNEFQDLSQHWLSREGGCVWCSASVGADLICLRVVLSLYGGSAQSWLPYFNR
ncbi:hypothetical protein L484_023695 [Morus notabilis]|uniref:Uncharacterized protein n=1 Tax=Morus notabilis TaxID=981085 RepID=W9RPF4_9ROSA|nr:hypothetical protein L484_023695 [Morus notabilis]